MKSLFTLTLAIFLSATCCAQRPATTKQNAISVELGKTGLLYSLTFDHRFAQKNYGFRLGVGSNLAKYLNAVSAGGGGYYLAGRTNHFFEIGADLQYLVVDEVSDDQRGFAFIYPDYTTRSLYPSLNAGYRRYGKHSLFRIGASPGFINSKFLPGGYLSYGWRF